MTQCNYFDVLLATLPEAVLTLFALGALVLDMALLRGQTLLRRMKVVGVFCALGCVAAVVVMLLFQPAAVAIHGLTVTPAIQALKIALLLITAAVIGVSLDTDRTPHVAEYFALMLFATTGFLLLVSATHLLMMFVALELAGLSAYLLVAFDKNHLRSAEAGLKYFLFGGVAAACMLFGMSLLYGLAGQGDFAAMAGPLHGGRSMMDAAVVVGLVLVLAGLAFKIAVVPFHLWAPDAYQGAPAPSAALIASGSKVAGFFLLYRLVHEGFGLLAGSAQWGRFETGWLPLLALLAALSMALGNLAALAQANVRRLLAYSAIAHSGYALLGVLAHSQSALTYYIITYACAVVGAFGVVALVERTTGGADLEHFNGLARRAPWLAASLMVFLLSLAGIPPLAGFFGKFYLFIEALRGPEDGVWSPGLLYLVILAIAMSTVSLYYYLQVLKRAYNAEPPSGAGSIGFSAPHAMVWLLAAAVLLLGCQPSWLLRFWP